MTFVAGDILKIRVNEDYDSLAGWIVTARTQLDYSMIYLKERTFEMREYSRSIVEMACVLDEP